MGRQPEGSTVRNSKAFEITQIPRHRTDSWLVRRAIRRDVCEYVEVCRRPPAKTLRSKKKRCTALNMESQTWVDKIANIAVLRQSVFESFITVSLTYLPPSLTLSSNKEDRVIVLQTKASWFFIMVPSFNGIQR